MNNNNKVGDILGNYNHLSYLTKGKIDETNKEYIVLSTNNRNNMSNEGTVLDFIPLHGMVLMIVDDKHLDIDFEKHSKHINFVSTIYSFDYHQVKLNKEMIIEEVLKADIHVGVKIPLIMYIVNCDKENAKRIITEDKL
jgi:hypothetical protein